MTREPVKRLKPAAIKAVRMKAALRRSRQQATMKRSQKQEGRVMSNLGGVVNPQSGAGWAKKNDGRAGQFLVEAKCRASATAKSITIRAEDLLDVERNAVAEGRTGVLTFELLGRDYFVLTGEDFEELKLISDGGTTSGTTAHRVRGT